MSPPLPSSFADGGGGERALEMESPRQAPGDHARVCTTIRGATTTEFVYCSNAAQVEGSKHAAPCHRERALWLSTTPSPKALSLS